MKTIYVSIGNSDDKLSQQAWSCFQIDVHAALNRATRTFHGSWHSNPGAPWQNACWCIEIADGVEPALRDELARIARNYAQDSIAWAEAHTEFIRGGS